MELVTRFFVRAREAMLRRSRGQTMTEYALILAAIAIVVWGAYQLMGQDISNLASGVDSALKAA